jgi:DNA polymerase-3 subunit delta
MPSDPESKLIILGSAGFNDEETEKVRTLLDDPEETAWFGDEINMSEFFSFVSSPSLFNPVKLAVVHNADKIKDLEAFMNQAYRCPEAVIILTAGIDAEKKLSAFQGFRLLVEKKKTRRDSIMEVQSAFEKHSLPCNYDAAEEIYDIFGGDLKQIRSEADKLSLYYAYKKPANSNEILKLITEEKQENIFAFIDCFAKRDRKECVRILDSLIKGGEVMTILFVMLAKRMKQIHLQKTIPSALQERMFILTKIKADASKWKPAELTRLAGEFAEMDYKIKTGQMRDTDAVYSLIRFV